MGDTLRISRTALARIVAEATGSADEVCGLLLGEPAEARACRNVHAEPGRHFEIDPAALLRAYREARGGGPRVIGHYHSHPSGNASPSRTDAENAAPDGSIWLIVGGGEARAWAAVERGAVHGRFNPAAVEVA